MSDRVETKRLNFWDCMGFCVGNIIGSGVMVLTGIVIGLTGNGTPLAFVGAGVVILLTLVPGAVLSSALPVNGGGYAYTKRILGSRVAFVYLGMFVLTNILVATYCKGFASYLAALLPGKVNEPLVAMAVLVICVAINIIGLKPAAVAQNIMVIVLLVALVLFAAFGFPKVEWARFALTRENILPNGAKNFFVGIALLTMATSGASFIFENGAEVENPRKNLPLSAMLSTVVVTVFYCLVGIVASGVLPVKDVAFKTLSDVANKIFPPAFYVFFIVGGAMFALATTINATLSMCTRAIQIAAKDGWLPAAVGKENKGGTPVIPLLIFFVFGAIPILTGMTMTTISTMGVGVAMICGLTIAVNCLLLPSRSPDDYERSPVKMKRSWLTFFTVLSVVISFATFTVSMSQLTPKIWLFIAIYVLVFVAYALIRGKKVDELAAKAGSAKA